RPARQPGRAAGRLRRREDGALDGLEEARLALRVHDGGGAAGGRAGRGRPARAPRPPPPPTPLRRSPAAAAPPPPPRPAAWRPPPAGGPADVAALARAAYEGRLLPAGVLEPACLAVLADALEDAGCADAELLGHLRSPGPHVRGCWALDAVLGKR